MKNSLRIACTLVIVCITASCSRVPKDVIPEKKMRKVLYDMQIAESMIETDNSRYHTNEEKRQLYEGVFAKHKITQAKYDSSLIWYGENMDLYMQIYQIVAKDIEKDIAAIGEIKQSPLSGEMSANDSLNIWIQRASFTFKPENSYASLVFDIQPQVSYTQGTSYILGFKVWGITPSMRYKPKVRLSAVQGDSIVTVHREITEDGYIEIVLNTVEAKPVQRLFGYVFLNNAGDRRRVYLNDIQLVKRNREESLSPNPSPQERGVIP